MMKRKKKDSSQDTFGDLLFSDAVLAHHKSVCRQCGSNVNAKPFIKKGALQGSTVVTDYFLMCLPCKEREEVHQAIALKKLNHDRWRAMPWDQAYADYMKSTTWFGIRKAAFDRAKNLCERCKTQTATEVHHKTYENFFGYERLDDLVAVCHPCHEILDEVREREVESKQYYAARAAWADKVYGEGKWDHIHPDIIDDGFHKFRERKMNEPY